MDDIKITFKIDESNAYPYSNKHKVFLNGTEYGTVFPDREFWLYQSDHPGPLMHGIGRTKPAAVRDGLHAIKEAADFWATINGRKP